MDPSGDPDFVDEEKETVFFRDLDLSVSLGEVGSSRKRGDFRAEPVGSLLEGRTSSREADGGWATRMV